MQVDRQIASRYYNLATISFASLIFEEHSQTQ